MTTFDEREEAFERRFAHDEELVFKTTARRNHKLGLWAADLMGKPAAEAETYALALVASGVEGGGDAALLQRVHADLAAAGVSKSDHQIHRQMDDLLVEAMREIRSA